MGPTADLPTPVPVIDKLQVNGGGETACIDISGKNFTPKLKVKNDLCSKLDEFNTEMHLLFINPNPSYN